MQEFPNIILYAIPFFIVSMVVEIIYTIKFNIKSYNTRDSVTSLSMGIGNVLLGFFSKAVVIAAFYFIYDNFRLFTIPISWWSFILIFFADDFSCASVFSCFTFAYVDKELCFTSLGF